MSVIRRLPSSGKADWPAPTTLTVPVIGLPACSPSFRTWRRCQNLSVSKGLCFNSARPSHSCRLELHDVLRRSLSTTDSQSHYNIRHPSITNIRSNSQEREGPLRIALREAHRAGICPPLASNSRAGNQTLRANEWLAKCRQSILTRQIPVACRNAHRQRIGKLCDFENTLSCLIDEIRLGTKLSAEASLNLTTAIQRSGYRRRQLLSHAQGLLEHDPLTSLRQILSIEDTERTDIPVFRVVLLAFLGRQYLDHATMSAISLHLSKHCATVSSTRASTNPSSSISEAIGHHLELLDSLHFLFDAYCQLFRHARHLWPELIPSLAANYIESAKLLLSRYRSVVARPFGLLQPFLTFLGNQILTSIAVPCSVSPYKNSEYQQAAINTVLQYMSAAENALALSMDGYRAVMRVQLALPKTAREKTWAQLKAPSWPPWKKDRTGLDDLIGLDYGVSRAGNVAAKAMEAGFLPGAWESVAMVYAGWDTDGSPTIQSRAVVPYFSPRKASDSHAWAARIRCTRTLQEAWACFLASEERMRADSVIYLAILEKAQLEQKRLRSSRPKGAVLLHTTLSFSPDSISSPEEDATTRVLLAGDAKEVEAPPANVQYETFTRTPPPTPELITRQMVKDQIAPTPSVLALLVRHSSGTDEVREHLMQTSRRPARYRTVLDPLQLSADRIRRVPKPVLTAVVGRLAATDKSLTAFRGNFVSFGDLQLSTAHPVVHAYRILISGDLYRPAVNALLASLAFRKEGFLINAMREWHDSTSLAFLADRILCARIARSLLSFMDDRGVTLDVEGFSSLCKIMERAAHSVRALDDASEDGQDLADVSSSIQTLLRQRDHSSYLHDRFYRLVGTTRRSPGPATASGDVPGRSSTPARSGTESMENPVYCSVPKLYAHPNPALLHGYIRALGANGDYKSILELAHWMRQFWPELRSRMAQDRSGRLMFRRVVIAMRALLQGHSLQVDETVHWTELEYNRRHHTESRTIEGIGSEYEAPPELVLEAMAIVESMDEWGGWPSWDEACEYRARAAG